MTKERCENCRYSGVLDGDLCGTLRCMKNPPVPIFFIDLVIGSQPPTFPHARCNEWQAKEGD